LRDVIVDLEDAEAFALRVVLDGPATVHGDDSAIAARVDEFALPAARTLQRGDDSFQRLGGSGFQQTVRDMSHRLLPAPAITTDRAFIPIRDAALAVSNKNSVVGQVQQGGLTCELRLLLSALCDVADDPL